MQTKRTRTGASKGRDSRPADLRPYVGDSGRKLTGPVDTIAVTSGMVLLALVVGFVVGFLVVLILNLSEWLTGALWGGYLDGSVELGAFPLVVCAVGGLVIGLWTLFSGSEVQPLEEVMSQFKRTGSYRMNPVKGAVSFLLPLVFGGSIGFEAGLTGLITAGCCWIRDKLKAAGLRAAAVADVTIAATLSAIFGAPFAGIVAGAESAPGGMGRVSEEPDVDRYNMRRPAKIVLYTAAAFGAFAGMKLFSSLFGKSGGFPHFDPVGAEGAQFLWALAAIALAYAMTWIYHGSKRASGLLAQRLGPTPFATVAKPVVAGIVMGALAIAFPYILFPGEEQSHMLMETWGTWTAAALIATGLLKALVTPMCINLGWVGGNFCPSIFAGAACGYGLAMLTGADPALMVTVVTTGFLAGVVRKPLLTIAILLLCFPVESILWCGLAAIVGTALPLPAFLTQSESVSDEDADMRIESGGYEDGR